MKYIEATIAALVHLEARRATKFVTPNRVISAQRITYQGRIDRRDATIDIRLKIGKPNYHERRFIKDCIKAGEPFPVKNIKLAYFRPRKTRKKRQ